MGGFVTSTGMGARLPQTGGALYLSPSVKTREGRGKG